MEDFLITGVSIPSKHGKKPQVTLPMDIFTQKKSFQHEGGPTRTYVKMNILKL